MNFLKTALYLFLLFNLLFSASLFSQHQLKNPAVVWEDLPYIRSGVQVWSHTSKSPLNRTVQDFLNYTAKEGNDYETADYKGKSGMLIHAWFAFLSPDTTGILKLYDSMGSIPKYNMPFKNYFNTNSYPHLFWEAKDAIWWAFPCMPFNGQFKALTSIAPQWYQYTLQTYREQRFAETISKADAAIIDHKMHQAAGVYPGGVPGNKSVTAAMHLAAGEYKTVFNDGNAGVIRQIKLVPAALDSVVMDSVFIRITTDDTVTAYLPVSFFFGGYAKVNMNNAKGMPAGFDGKALYNYFPMPYWKSFRIELDNTSKAPVDFSATVNWSNTNPYPQNKTGVFKVQYNKRTPVKAGEPDFINLSVQGSGLMVGAVSQLTGAVEANFSMHIDGLKTPNIESTGGEDYFNHSYGLHPGFTRPFSGGLGDTAAYRFHIIDYIPFLNSFTFSQDHALYQTHDRDGIFNSAVFYYYNPKQYLVVTDSVDIGNTTSETLHKYTIKGTKSRLQTDTGAYEGNFNSLFEDKGRWTNGTTSFTVKLTKNNDGVRLRKRINQTAYHQEVKVYVDNVLAGTWFEQGANYYLNKRLYYNDSLPNWQKGNVEAKFRETEFNIPAALTKGKSSVNIRIENVGSLAVDEKDKGLTNEYYYRVFCYLPFE